MRGATIGAVNAQSPDRATLVAFIGIVVLGGFNGISITFSNEELQPFWGATLRFGLASLLLFGLVALRGVALPRGRALIGSVVYGLLGFGLTYACAYTAIAGTGAALAQVILTLVPLVTLIFAVAVGLERFRAPGVVGTLIAATGIVIVFGDRLATDVPLLPVLIVLAGAAAIAAASVVVKRFPHGHPLATNAVAMGVGALLLFGLSVAAGERPALPTEPSTLAAVAYLVIFGSIVVFMLYLFVIERWTASATSYSLLAMPLVTVPAAALIRNEPITLALVAGGALVLAGVYVGAFAPSISRPFPGLFRRPLAPATSPATAAAGVGAAAGEGPPSLVSPNCP
jgi:drug/metabolite transporter (DMT)-like permease